MAQLAKVTHRQFLKIYRDYAKAATLADLVYVLDNQPGIERYKKGRGYMYIYAGKPLHKKEDINRIRSLAIPPSWTSVWICALPNGHIQATGLECVNVNNTVTTLCGRFYVMKLNFTAYMNLEKPYLLCGADWRVI